MSSEILIHKNFKMYANCIPVRGASRSLICDIQRGSYNFITNDLYYILTKQQHLPIADIIDFYGAGNEEIIIEYFNFMLSEDYIFFCEYEELALFPDMNLLWEHPSIITNAIVDVDGSSNHNFKNIFEQLLSLGCQALQLRFFHQTSFIEVSKIIDLLDVSAITSIEIIMPCPSGFRNEMDIKSFVQRYLRISLLIIYSASSAREIQYQDLAATKIILTDQNMIDESCCGNISKEYFSINIETFTESQTHNSCLNRKISIDAKGEIKNCPSMSNSFGNINCTTLEHVTQLESFATLGSIDKNQISVCKDCEFRYICTDCRAFRMDDDIFSKPAKCKYNPYTETWEN